MSVTASNLCAKPATTTESQFATNLALAIAVTVALVLALALTATALLATRLRTPALWRVMLGHSCRAGKADDTCTRYGAVRCNLPERWGLQPMSEETRLLRDKRVLHGYLRDPAWWRPDGSFDCPAGRLTRWEVEQATIQFKAYDIDADGLVSFPDFCTAMVAHDPTLGQPAHRAQLAAMYRSADIDQDGRVELLDFLRMRLDAGRADFFARMAAVRDELPPSKCRSPQ